MPFVNCELQIAVKFAIHESDNITDSSTDLYVRHIHLYAGIYTTILNWMDSDMQNFHTNKSYIYIT